MKRYYLFFALLFSIFVSLPFCKIEVYTDKPTKDELSEMFINLSDNEIDALQFDLVNEVKQSFSDTLFEQLLLKRASKHGLVKTRDLLVDFFDTFRKSKGCSFASASGLQVEDFALEYRKQMQQNIVTERSTCEYPWQYCNGQSPNCPQQGNFIFYSQNNYPNGAIPYDVECHRQAGSQDCDYSYFWYATDPILQQNPNLFEFWWYSSNAIYRALMQSGISGFIHPISGEFSTFLGNQHFIAAHTAWAGNECIQDIWMSSTKFGARKRIIGPNPGVGTIDDPKPKIATPTWIEIKRIERNQ